MKPTSIQDQVQDSIHNKIFEIVSLYSSLREYPLIQQVFNEIQDPHIHYYTTITNEQLIELLQYISQMITDLSELTNQDIKTKYDQTVLIIIHDMLDHFIHTKEIVAYKNLINEINSNESAEERIEHILKKVKSHAKK